MTSIDASGGDGGVSFGVVAGSEGQGSGLLAAPLALHGPPQELLHVPRHVHGVVQVELAVRVQHGVTPAEAGEQSDNHVSEELSGRNAGEGPQTPFFPSFFQEFPESHTDPGLTPPNLMRSGSEIYL